MQILERRIQTLVQNGGKLLAERHADSPYIQSQISDLQDRWNNLKNQANATRKLIDLSVPYFQLVEEVIKFSKYSRNTHHDLKHPPKSIFYNNINICRCTCLTIFYFTFFALSYIIYYCYWKNLGFTRLLYFTWYIFVKICPEIRLCCNYRA